MIIIIDQIMVSVVHSIKNREYPHTQVEVLPDEAKDSKSVISNKLACLPIDS